MEEPGEVVGRGRPWHSWVVALVVLGIYAMGAVDYVRILADDTGYLQGQFGPAVVEYFDDYPPLLRVLWTVNILGGIVAPVLVMLRSRRAVPVAAVAAGAQAVLNAVTFAYRGRWEAFGPMASLFDIGVGVITLAFAGYCVLLRRRAVLR